MLNSPQIKLKGQQYSISGNQPLLLNQPETVWVVQSGSIALFAITITNHPIEGPRQYLFSVGPGDALFGASPELARSYHQFLAVPEGDAGLLQVDREFFQTLVANGDARVVDWVENWLQQISSVLSPMATPAIRVRTAGQNQFLLNAGQMLQPEPEAIVWVAMQQGTMQWLGFRELILTSTAGFVPLSYPMWLEAIDSVELATESTTTFTDTHILFNGLSQFHQQVLLCLLLLKQQEVEEESQRLQEQKHHNRQVTEAALAELASPLAPNTSKISLDGPPLLVAVGAVGRALGITIRPPGKSVDLKRLREPLEAIVRTSRTRMRQVLLQDRWWEQDCGPLLAYRQLDNRPVALLPISATRYEIFDPIEESRIPVDAHSAATLASVAYMLYRSLPDKALKAVDLLRFALQGRTRDLLLIVLAGLTITLLGMLTPQATAILIDSAIPDSNRGLLLQVGLGLLVVAIGSTLFRLAQGFALLRLETISDASTQAAVWDRLLNLPVSFFRDYTTGDLQSRVTSINQIRRQFGGTTLLNLISALFALLNLGLLLRYSFRLALIAVTVAFVTTAITSISSVLLLRKVHPLLELRGKIFGLTVQLINGISKLRVAGAEERAFAFWSRHYSQQIKLELSTQYIEDGVALCNVVIPTLTSAVLFWFTVPLLTGENRLSMGAFLAFNAAFGTFIKGATDLSNLIVNTLQVIPQWKRAQPILETRPEVDSSKADSGRLKGSIIIDRVTFRYRTDGPLILDHVTIQAEPGEFVAIVGSSGSGKSTLFRLLLGFETPEAGAVYYDGQDLSGLNIDTVRRQLGVVLQSGRIMSASLFENIASGARITQEEAWEAACMAGLADDIEAMPMQMHTVISEGGSNLSGGQRQRLLIARALALKPRILLFDEATSALDNRTQAIVSESLDKLNVTRIVIAHRLSTIRNANRIYVFQAGSIVQQGSFETLADQKGLFAQLMARQIV